MDFSGGFRIARIRGIAIVVHWSWAFIFVTIAWNFAEGVLPRVAPEWDASLRWAVGAAASFVFFLSVLLHELSHAFVALHYQMRVPSITLFIFGGLSAIEGEMRNAREEFGVAIAGPTMSVVLGAVLVGAGYLAPGAAGDVLADLGVVNLILGVFNLLPGFPLDGGRVFRSLVWARTQDLQRSTALAARVGGIIGWVMIAIGAAVVFRGNLSGLWYMFIGFFLKNAADNARDALTIERAVTGVSVAEVMRPAPEAVDAGTTLQRLVEDHVLDRGERATFVQQDGHAAGIVTTTDLARVPRERHASTTVAEIMVPTERVVTAAPETPLSEALRLLIERDVHQLPVVDAGRLVGLLTRGDIFRHIETRRRLARPRTHP